MADPKTNGPDGMQLIRRAEEMINSAALAVEAAVLHIERPAGERLKTKLEDAERPFRAALATPTQPDCERCGGSGEIPGESGGMWSCPDCVGQGTKPPEPPAVPEHVGDWPPELTVYKRKGFAGKPTLDRPGTASMFGVTEFEKRTYIPAAPDREGGG